MYPNIYLPLICEEISMLLITFRYKFEINLTLMFWQFSNFLLHLLYEQFTISLKLELKIEHRNNTATPKMAAFFLVTLGFPTLFGFGTLWRTKFS